MPARWSSRALFAAVRRGVETLGAGPAGLSSDPCAARSCSFFCRRSRSR